jgi:hypothetical protein
MRPVQKTFGSVAASTTSLAAAQTATGVGALTLVASPSFTYAQQVSLTATANYSGNTITITGVDADGHTISETLAGPNVNTVNSVQFYQSVSSITTTGGISTNISAGNTAASVSRSFIVDYINSVASLSYACVPTATTVTFKLQHTYDDPFSLVNTKTWFDDSTITSKTAATAVSLTGPIRASRMQITAWTAGTVTGTLIQGLEK